MKGKFFLLIFFSSFAFFLYFILHEKRTENLSFDNEKDIERGIEKDPKNGLLYYKKAVYMLKNKEYEKVFKNCNVAIEMGFPVYDCYILMAIASYEKNDYKLQEYYSTLAIEKDPLSYEGYLMRARAYYYLGIYRKAILDFNVAYDITKDDEVLYEIALAYKEMKKYISALNILRLLYKKYPQNLSIVYLLIEIYKEMKLYNNSLYLIDKHCSTKGSQSLECKKRKLEILYEMGDYEYALIEAKSMFKLGNSLNSSFYCNLVKKNGFYQKHHYCKG